MIKMDKQITIPNELYEDEAICFIADRHHVSSQKRLQYFLLSEGMSVDGKKKIQMYRLEDNEIEILRGLIGINH